MRNLLLTGFMATGKSTVGRTLAEQYGLRFVDLDHQIESRAGQPIPQLMADSEARFRQVEHELLREVLRDSGAVIATGGGALTFERNRELLGADDVVVALTCSLEAVLPRLGDRASRPLVAGLEDDEIGALMDARRPIYTLFPSVDTTELTPDEVADEVANRALLQQAALFSMQRTAGSTLLFRRSLLNSAGEVIRARCMTGDVLVVSDERLAAAGHLEAVVRSFPDDQAVHTAVLPAGEEHKTLAGLETIYNACAKARLDRSSTVVGVGGGVIGDMAGLAAATYVRGVRLALVPTTLLAQVDAAIGGKVGIDFGRTKNMIGAFHPAEVVIIDPEALRTLPVEALRDGLAEIIKIALVRSASLLQSVEELKAATDILERPAIIRQAAVEKVRVVAEDPYESGVRALLNFGHTIGHGIEAASEYRLSHGQCVAIGMVAEMRIALRQGVSSRQVLMRLEEALGRFGLLSTAHGLDPASVLAHVLHDKKRSGGRIRFAVPVEEPGQGTVMEVGMDDVELAVRFALGGEV